jgi:hypothetical protein
MKTALGLAAVGREDGDDDDDDTGRRRFREVLRHVLGH